MSSVEQPGAGQGPWSAGVAAAFGDDEVLAARVNQFMQTHYQPYVTRLENERNAAAQHTGFYQAFQGEDTAGPAFLALAEEMFGAEGASAIVDALGAEEPEEVPAVSETNDAPQFATLSPADQELIEWARAQREHQQLDADQQEYEALKGAFLAADATRATVKGDLFDPFVAANDGDFDAALTAYNQFVGNFQPAPTPTPAPATLPSSTATPATAERYHTFDDAWDAFQSELDALKPAPPTV